METFGVSGLEKLNNNDFKRLYSHILALFTL